MPQSQPIGTDITSQIFDRIATGKPLAQQQREINQAPPAFREKATFLALLLSSAVAEACAQYQKRGERGLVLCDRMGPLQVWYLPRTQWAQAIIRVPDEVQDHINLLLKAYDPSSEGIVVMKTGETIYPLYVTSTGETRSLGSMPRTPLKLDPPLELPPGVSMARTTKVNGAVTYTFTDQQLGPLGRVTIAGMGVGQSEFQVEVLGGDPHDPAYEKRLALFEPIAHRLEQALIDNELITSPNKGLETMAESTKLYATFITVQSSFEMQLLLEQLSEEEVETLLHLAEQTAGRASQADARAIRQRIEDVKQLQRTPLSIGPVVRGLHQFIQAKTDREARRILLARPDLLLSPEAEQELAEFISDDPVSKAHLEKRRRLFRRLQRRQGK